MSQRKIYKYNLEKGINSILIPKGSKFLSIDIDGYQLLAAYYEVNTLETDGENVKFNVIWTREICPPEDDYKFVSTVKLPSGIVVHVYIENKDD